VDDIRSSAVFCKHDNSLLDLGFLPWTERYLVLKMYDERIHAVALRGDGHSLPFGNQSADFRHHDSLLFNNRTHMAPKISKI